MLNIQTGLLLNDQAILRPSTLTERTARFSPKDTNITEIPISKTKVSFRPSCLIKCDVSESRKKSLRNDNRENNLLSQNGNGNAYNGYISPATTRKIKELLSTWITSIEVSTDLKHAQKSFNRKRVYLTFVTLTLPSVQLHSDKKIKELLLNPFIKWLCSNENEVYKTGKWKGQQKGFGVVGYLWRAEAQKNGRIHFHLIIDRYVHWERIREMWIKMCDRLGYVTRYSNIQKAKVAADELNAESGNLEAFRSTIKSKLKNVDTWDLEELADLPITRKYVQLLQQHKRKKLTAKMIGQMAEERRRYVFEQNQKSDWRSPNCTDIHKIAGLHSVTAYVVKYITKMPTEKPLKANQKVEFNDNFGRKMLHTYGEEIDLHGKVRSVITDIEEYQPQFEEGKIDGRLWSCSKALKATFGKDESIEIADDGKSFLVSKTTDEKGNESIKRREVAVLKYYRKTLGYTSGILSRNGITCNLYVMKLEVQDEQLDALYEKAKELAGIEEVKRISALVGDSFERMHGEIVPLPHIPQKTLPKGTSKGKSKRIPARMDLFLKENSPSLYQNYINYHKNIFNHLYN